jgi:hypothetical protein
MFRVIGGIVVYGFALYGVAVLVSRKPDPDSARGGLDGHSDEMNRQPEEGQIGAEVAT